MVTRAQQSEKVDMTAGGDRTGLTRGLTSKSHLFNDQRTETIFQKKQQERMVSSPRLKSFGLLQAKAQNPSVSQRPPARSNAKVPATVSPAIQRKGTSSMLQPIETSGQEVEGAMAAGSHPGSYVIQRRILKDIIEGGKSIWPANYVLKPRQAESLIGWAEGKVAFNPNVTVMEKLNDMEEDAKFEGLDQVERKVGMIRQEFSSLLYDIRHGGLTWDDIKAKWKRLDYDIENQFIQLQRNKWDIGQHTFNLDTSESSNIAKANDGNAWRKRSEHMGRGTKLPYPVDQHYAVGNATSSKAGPERIYTKNVRLKNNEPGIHAYYSADHGDNNRLNSKNNITRLISNDSIDGKRIVSPWDPYLETREGKESN